MSDVDKKDAQDRSFRLLFVLVVAVCALATAVLAVSVLDRQSGFAATQGKLEAENRARLQLEACITQWASMTTERTATLFEASQARQKALDGLIAAVAHNNSRRFERALRHYEFVVKRFNAEAKAHPVPAAPLFLCNQ